MPGELIKDYVLIRDEKEASRIYNKGYYGEVKSGGSLKLALIEATFLAELGRIEVFKSSQKLELKDLVLYATELYKGFEIKYTVYRDFRQRGYVIKGFKEIEGIDFEAYPRGGAPNKTKSKFLLAAISERTKFKIEELTKLLENAKRARKQLLLGIVDEEGDLTYYRVAKVKPKSKVEFQKPSKVAEATFLKDRSIVWNSAQAEELLKTEFYGKSLGKALQLSLTETSYLLEKDLLEVKDAKTMKPLTFDTLFNKSKKLQPGFELSFKAYKDMKKRGLLVKTGFKYGTHFRVYDDLPDKVHARYLAHAVPQDYISTWPEISRAVRLAHGVKKEILFARVGEKVEYLRLGRVRP
ncbi:MAG: tRNA-intron lyase [Candidatus Thermoplasmatota archaeon]|nr:tRNA-intron lyase [Candidatus Thermoplasmatota archaeon]